MSFRFLFCHSLLFSIFPNEVRNLLRCLQRSRPFAYARGDRIGLPSEPKQSVALNKVRVLRITEKRGNPSLSLRVTVKASFRGTLVPRNLLRFFRNRTCGDSSDPLMVFGMTVKLNSLNYYKSLKKSVV